MWMVLCNNCDVKKSHDIHDEFFKISLSKTFKKMSMNFFTVYDFKNDGRVCHDFFNIIIA